MKNRIDYLIKDTQCAEAIESFKTLSSVPMWLEQYSDLFDSVTIKPEGLPRITSINFGGESFENIRQFSRLYETVNSLY